MSESERVLRNAVCHCGTGIKYKHCHGRFQTTADNELANKIVCDSGPMLSQLLVKSEKLNIEIADILNIETKSLSVRTIVTLAMIGVTLEHINSQRLLIASSFGLTALSLVRLQYESLIRSIWLHYCASDEWIDSFSTPMESDQVQEPIKGPSVDAMLLSIESGAPLFVGTMLRDFKNVSWMPMNSFVHGGIHAVAQSRKRVEPQQSIKVLRNANGMALMAANLYVIAINESSFSGWIRKLQNDYGDVLPPQIC